MRGLQIGRLFGTDIFVAPSFLLMMALLFLLVGAERVPIVAVAALALIFSILVHEFGHVFAVRRFLGSGSTIMLWAIGGLTFHESTSSRHKRIGIALMGPAFGLVLGLAFLGIYQLVPGASAEARGLQFFVFIMVWINLLWTALNLLPIYPLDGGQALLAGLEYKLTPARARRAVAVVSVVTAAGGLAASLAVGMPFMALMAGWLLIQNLSSIRAPGP